MSAPTVQEYHQDTYRFESTGRVVSVRDATAEETAKTGATHAVILDSTIFYPQGGGQPADTGSIRSAGAEFEVRHVTLQMDTGVITHLGVYTSGSLSSGDETKLNIDGAKRILHSRLHSAGHYIDLLIQRADPRFKPQHALSGYHFTDGPRVDYALPEGVTAAFFPALKTAMEAEMARISAVGGVDISTADMTLPEAEAMLGPEMLSDKARASSVVRVVSFGGQGSVGASACAGTHVRHSSELGTLTLRKMNAKGSTLRISYALS